MERETIHAEPVKVQHNPSTDPGLDWHRFAPPVCRDQLLINFRFDLKDRQIPQTLPGLRLSGPAHRLRGE
jgi:hypothetical protein